MKTFRYFINRWGKLEKQEMVGRGDKKKKESGDSWVKKSGDSWVKKNPKPGYPEEIPCPACGKPSGVYSPCLRVFLTDYHCPNCGAVVVRATNTYC